MKRNPWQIAVSENKNLPVRKWQHLGTFYSPSSLSAAYDAVRGYDHGRVVETFAGDGDSVIYKFQSGLFCRVH